MSKKKPVDVKPTAAYASTAELEEPSMPITGSETLANLELLKCAGDDLHQGLVIAEDFTSQIVNKLEQAITVLETVKKIPDYNADLCIMQIMKTAQLKTLTYDRRNDDKYI